MLKGIDFLFIVSYFIIVLGIGILSKRKQTEEGFLIANRQLNWWHLTMTISAGALGGGVLVAFVAYVYQFGLAAMWFPIGIAVGFLVLLVFSKKLKELADEGKFYTLPDYFYSKYGRRVGLLATFVIFIWSMSFILMQFIAGGRVLTAISGFPYYFSVLIMGLVVTVYLVLGGFKAVVRTDVFQYFTIILLGLLLFIPLGTNAKILPGQLNIMAMGVTQSIAFLFIGAFNIVISADIWQRIYASRNQIHAKRGLIGSAILIIVASLMLSIIGLAVRNKFENIIPDNALIYGISNLLPSGFLGLGLVVLFAVIMSTLDTALFVISMNISQDMVSHFKNLSKASLVKITRYSTLSLALIGMLIALLIENIVTVGLALSGIGLSLAPVAIGSFYFRLKKRAVFYSILSGLITIGIVLGVGIIGPETSAFSLPISAIVLTILQKVLKS